MDSAAVIGIGTEWRTRRRSVVGLEGSNLLNEAWSLGL